MTVQTFNLSGYANGTDIGAVTGFTRAYGASGELVVNADGRLDITTANETLATVDADSVSHSIETEFAVASDTSNMICAVNVIDVNNMYCSRWSGGNVEIWQRIAGTFTNLATVSASFSNADKLKLEWNNTTQKLTTYKNGTAISGATNISPANILTASTLVGLHGRSQGATDLIDGFVVEGISAYNISSVNSGNPVKVGSTFSSAVSGFTGAASGTMDSKALTGVSYTTNTITAMLPSYVDGGTYFEPDTTQTLTFVNGSETANTEAPTASPDGMDSVVLATPNMADSTYLTYWIPTSTDDDRIVFPTEGGDFDVSETGRVTCSTAGLRVLWHWNSETSVMTRLNVTVNEVGDVVGFGLTSTGLSSSGLTSSGLTSR